MAEGISGSLGAWVPRAAGEGRGQVHPGAARLRLPLWPALCTTAGAASHILEAGTGSRERLPAIPDRLPA